MRAAEEAERDRAADERAHLAHGLERLLRLGQHALGVREEQPPGVGELDAPAGPDEQRDAELGLEPADLLGHARLRHQERVRGRRKAPVLGRGEEVFELLQPHRLSLSTT